MSIKVKGVPVKNEFEFESELAGNHSHSDNDLKESVWTIYANEHPLTTVTCRPYPYWKGVIITGLYSGDRFLTLVGDFQVEVGNRGASPGVIVFSTTGIGYVFQTA